MVHGISLRFRGHKGTPGTSGDGLGHQDPRPLFHLYDDSLQVRFLFTPSIPSTTTGTYLSVRSRFWNRPVPDESGEPSSGRGVCQWTVSVLEEYCRVFEQVVVFRSGRINCTPVSWSEGPRLSR